MECGSPGNPKGVHQSGSGAAEAMIAPQECKETLDQVVGNAEGQHWSVGRKGEGETGKKEDGVGGGGAGNNSQGRWGKELECFTSSQPRPTVSG